MPTEVMTPQCCLWDCALPGHKTGKVSRPRRPQRNSDQSPQSSSTSRSVAASTRTRLSCKTSRRAITASSEWPPPGRRPRRLRSARLAQEAEGASNGLNKQTQQTEFGKGRCEPAFLFARQQLWQLGDVRRDVFLARRDKNIILLR